MPQPTILCAAYGGGHINACLPVVRALHERGWNVHLLALTTAFASTADSDFKVWQARDLIGAEDCGVIELGERIVGEGPQSGPVSREESVAYHGLGMSDLIASYGVQEAEAIFAVKGRAAFEHGELANRILDRTNPDIVLTSNSPRAEKAVIDAAQTRNIPAAVLNDTLASVSNYWLHNPDYANRILVISDPVRQMLIQSGHDPAKILVTGNPALEPMAALKARRAYRPTPARRGVLYASQPLSGGDGEHKARVLTQLAQIAGDRPDLAIKVRLHPNEAGGEVGQFDQLAVSDNLDLADDLYDADVLITHGSTVGIEAALAGIPVILQNGSFLAANCRFGDYGIAMPCDDVTELGAAIDRALTDGVAPSFSMPDDALGNVVGALREMINSD